jgi:hypothetical protein
VFSLSTTPWGSSLTLEDAEGFDQRFVVNRWQRINQTSANTPERRVGYGYVFALVGYIFRVALYFVKNEFIIECMRAECWERRVTKCCYVYTPEN